MKLLMKLAIALVLLVVIAIGAVFFYVDAAAKAAIERGGTYALGVPTTLGSANVGVIGGEFTLDRLDIANPDGFDAPEFLAIRHGHVSVTFSSLRGDTVELPDLTLTGVTLNLERRNGKANYDVIVENLKRVQSDDKKEPAEPKEPKQPGKQFVIREVLIQDITVSAELLPIGGSLTKATATIPEIRLKDVGTANDSGADMAEIMAALTQAILRSALRVDGLPAELTEGLEATLSGLGSLSSQGIEVLTDASGTLEVIGGSASGVGKVLEETGKGIGDALEGFGKLLGGDEKDE